MPPSKLSRNVAALERIQALARGDTYELLLPTEARLLEVTFRSVLWGILLCIIFTVASAYSRLKVGQAMESAIPTCMLTIGLREGIGGTRPSWRT